MNYQKLSDEELYEFLLNCKSKSDAQRKLGICGVSGTSALEELTELCNCVGLDVNKLDVSYRRNLTRKEYENNPKLCLNCGKPIPFKDRLVKNFCNRSCSATYNNKKRGKRSDETRMKISNSLKDIERRKTKSLPNTKEIYLLDGSVKKLFPLEALNLFYDEKISFENIKSVFPNLVQKCVVCGKDFVSKLRKGGRCSKSTTCSDECNRLLKVKRGKEMYNKLKADDRFQGWKSRNIKSYAEKFWEKVLNNNNIKFERELYIKPYFLDFVIRINGHVIDLEIDGKQHEYEDRKESDKKRDAFLKDYGFCVYRIKWNDIKSEEGSKMMKSKIDKFLMFYKDLAGWSSSSSSGSIQIGSL